jgi:hypothetical protein
MTKRRNAFGIITLCVLCLSVGAYVYVQGQKKTRELPNIVSRVESVEMVKAELENPDKGDSLGKLTFKNNSQKPIIAVCLSAGPVGKSDMYFKIGEPEGKYRVISQPDEAFVLTAVPGNFRQGFPIRLSAVVYDDGTAAGEERTVEELMKAVKETHSLRTGGQ